MLTGLSQGNHTFQALARDAAGNVDSSPAAVVWTVDTVAPDTLFDLTPQDPSGFADATFQFHSTEDLLRQLLELALAMQNDIERFRAICDAKGSNVDSP